MERILGTGPWLVRNRKTKVLKLWITLNVLLDGAGGGAAAAYEAARADHYAQKNAEQQRRASSLGLGIGAGGNLGGGGMPQMGFSVNPNQ